MNKLGLGWTAANMLVTVIGLCAYASLYDNPAIFLNAIGLGLGIPAVFNAWRRER